MKPDKKLKAKLDTLVHRIVPEGRAQVEETIASVVRAGGTSENALVEISCNRGLEESLRLGACWLLPRLELAKAGEVLTTLMSDPSEQMRGEAAVGLGLVSPDNVGKVLLTALEQDRSKSVRLAIIHALGMLGLPESAHDLTALLQNPAEDAEVRADAAEALAHVKAARVVEVLIDALNDGSPLIRYSAAYALGEQGDTKALPVLRRLASRDDATTPWGSVASRALDAMDAIMNRSERGVSEDD